MSDNLAVRTQFTNELVALTTDLTQMCQLSEEAAARVTDALVDADLTATYEVFAVDEQLQQLYSTCEERTVALLALQAPVARDLRHVMTAIQIAGELSRITWLTSRVADQVYLCHPDPIAPEHILDVFAAMGRVAVSATARAGRAVASGQQDPAADIESATSDLKAMESLNRKLHTELAAPAWHGSTEDAITLALLGHHLERAVDHIRHVERLIRFLETGVPPTAQGAPDE